MEVVTFIPFHVISLGNPQLTEMSFILDLDMMTGRKGDWCADTVVIAITLSGALSSGGMIGHGWQGVGQMQLR